MGTYHCKVPTNKYFSRLGLDPKETKNKLRIYKIKLRKYTILTNLEKKYTHITYYICIFGPEASLTHL